jgi:hypothetical protein
MKAAALFLLFAGLPLAFAAFALLPPSPARIAFVFAALAVQLLGLILIFRAYFTHSDGHGMGGGQ